jgi:hypothetical protein
LEQNEQSLERTFHRCFLQSFTSFGWGVSEENIKMWKVNRRQPTDDGRQTTDDRGRKTDTKWWLRLTLPLARWAKKDKRTNKIYKTLKRKLKIQLLECTNNRGCTQQINNNRIFLSNNYRLLTTTI